MNNHNSSSNVVSFVVLAALTTVAVLMALAICLTLFGTVTSTAMQ